jgi:hypothetical protein
MLEYYKCPQCGYDKLGGYLHRILNHQLLSFETVSYNGYTYMQWYRLSGTDGIAIIIYQTTGDPFDQITAIFKIKLKYNAKISNR